MEVAIVYRFAVDRVGRVGKGDVIHNGLGAAVGLSPRYPMWGQATFFGGGDNTCEYIRCVYGVQGKEMIRVWHHTFLKVKHSFLWLAVRETRIDRDEAIVYRYQPEVQTLTVQPFSRRKG